LAEEELKSRCVDRSLPQVCSSNTKKIRVLLINPPFYRFFQQKSSYFPKGLGYIASVLEKNGVHVRIYNADCEDNFKLFFVNRTETKNFKKYIARVHNLDDLVYKEICEVIANEQPDVIGISVSTSAYKAALNIAVLSKKISPNVKIVFGGIHPTVLPEEVLQTKLVDIVVRGEGEFTFLEIIEALENGKPIRGILGASFVADDGSIVHNPNRELIKDLDILPFPARHLVINSKGTNNSSDRIMTSRGCPFGCTFCDSNQIWGRKARFRSVKNITDEIKDIKRKFGITSFCIDDDTFTINPNYVEELCDEFIKENLGISWWCETRTENITESLVQKMKKAGCTFVAIGIESGDDNILKKINKQLDKKTVLKSSNLFKKYGILVDAFFMFGFPWENKIELENTIKFMRELNPNYAWLAIIIPYPGTKLFIDYSDTLKKLGKRPDWVDWIHINPRMAFLLNDSITKKEKSNLLNYAQREFDKYNFIQFLKRWKMNPISLIKSIKQLLSKPQASSMK